MRTILIVDDEPIILETLDGILADEGFSVVAAADGEKALARISDNPPDAALLDIWMPRMDGLECLERIKADYPNLPVVMMSGAGTIDSAVKAIKLGAFDYIEKPLSYEKIIVTINNALSFSRVSQERDLLRAEIPDHRRLTGSSPAMEEIRRQIELAAPTDASVLITGESGSGKEVAARSIHAASPRADRPMIEVNCAAIPEELIESELFGYERGAFTGADKRKPGKFDLAHKGAILLDEIADMSLKTQAKVLRILQERKFERVGGARTIAVDVRVIAATNSDLEQEIAAGRFRADLFYRLNVIPIHLPPIRERGRDVIELAGEFLNEFAAKFNQPPKRLTEAAAEALLNHHWPGNVREVRNLVERLVILHQGDTIDVADLPQPFGESGRTPIESPIEPTTLKEARAEFERRFITRELDRNQGNVTAAASALGMERSHLYKKLKMLGLKT